MTQELKDTILRGSFGEVTELAEGARLESVCTLTGYRGFESPLLRQTPIILCDIRGFFILSNSIAAKLLLNLLLKGQDYVHRITRFDLSFSP